LKVAFSKITTSPKKFTYQKEGLKLDCELFRKDKESISLNGTISGEITLECDRCAKKFKENINWELELLLSNIALKDVDNLDIIEFLNSEIDLEFVLDSEVNSYKLLYHHCESCKNDDTEFCMEF
jgi:uncharacterized metal-binding protein YceD (DUF177 family)